MSISMMRTKVFEQDEITNVTRSISFVNKEGQGGGVERFYSF